jgi:hypothetical protein
MAEMLDKGIIERKRSDNFENRDNTITTWKEFGEKVRSKGCDLLKRIDDFPASILVTGCQRSGTTMLANILIESQGMVDYRFGRDSELDGALILSGAVDHTPRGRYCFQTTYLNQCLDEYFEMSETHKIIWVIRNPFSVVYSMLNNWKSFSFDELFQLCGVSELNGLEKWSYRLFGLKAINPLIRACHCYNSRVSQLFTLRSEISQRRLLMVDYDELVSEKDLSLPDIYRYCGLAYYHEYAEKIHKESLNKASRFNPKDRSTIQKLCWPTYQKARLFLSETK